MPIDVLVSIDSIEGGIAFCEARWHGRWLPIHLDAQSLEDIGLFCYDTFRWIPQHDDIVRMEDVTEHPHIFAAGEVDNALENWKNCLGLEDYYETS